jgi:hypothetical protein
MFYAPIWEEEEEEKKKKKKNHSMLCGLGY